VHLFALIGGPYHRSSPQSRKRCYAPDFWDTSAFTFIAEFQLFASEIRQKIDVGLISGTVSVVYVYMSQSYEQMSVADALAHTTNFYQW